MNKLYIIIVVTLQSLAESSIKLDVIRNENSEVAEVLALLDENRKLDLQVRTECVVISEALSGGARARF